MFNHLGGSGSAPRNVVLAVGVLAAAATLAACSSSSMARPSSSGGGSSTNPGTMFSTANVPGLGPLVVDGRGRTVYILTADGRSNAPCTDSSGCTKVWPDLPLPGGTATVKAGNGIEASLLGTKKSSDGQIYPTYHGWLVYEYAADSGPMQATGQAITSFGGTWYALRPSGTPITTSH